ncbi:radical SAM protein [Butyrivibrio sp. INlla16]|uniref:radical SAM protein n=1 Tax=Butyrivibrio sp. INlla16 TaxID=1520807 RepID=UPI000891807A|nr:radical SAM protein [Butyrivibrio sp. INlla16]SDB50137.1 Radical SAM superfamily enzyme, MoaA/NifB/PqqE/SkfB family [Butyrivibrio sp. INlla16]
MGELFQTFSHKAQREAIGMMIDSVLKKTPEKRREFYLRIAEMAKFFFGSEFTDEQYENVKAVIKGDKSRWMQYIDRVITETDPHIAKTTLLNLGYEAFLRGTKTIRSNREKYGCNIPWLILFDPTSACNMHCKGCWSGTYGRKYTLSYEEMDKIVTQGKELGVYLYMMTGGEPLVRKADVLKLAKEHRDVQFALYTNSTLIDEELCEEVQKVGNIMFLLSIEGTPETNDSRRGEGHYAAVLKAMDLLREHGILFGTSICYTRENVEAVTSDEFYSLLMEKGARFGFYFHYMPVGNSAVPELMPTVEQRQYMIDRIRYIRSEESGIEFFPMDFQNDGKYVGGCIAGGRNYFHINSAGDAEPCVFIHYSNANIKDSSILEILQSPLFMAYHKGQPFNKDHLRPCPMLENPDCLREMVKESKAVSTDLESPEEVEHLCGKCDDYAESWGNYLEEERTPARVS